MEEMRMNEIVKLYKNHPVRIVDRGGESWFVAKDVAACIEYAPSSINKMCNLCRDKDKVVISKDEIETNDLLVSNMTR